MLNRQRKIKNKVVSMVLCLSVIFSMLLISSTSVYADTTGVVTGIHCRFKNVSTGKYLAASEAMYASYVQQAGNQSSSAQSFLLSDTDGPDAPYYNVMSTEWVDSSINMYRMTYDMTNGVVSTLSDTYNVMQQWKIAYYGAGKFKILSRYDESKAVTASTSSSAISLGTYSGADSQLWYIEILDYQQNLSNGKYYIKNNATGLYLDLSGGATANSTPVVQWPFHGETNQQWNVSFENGEYRITSVCAPDKSLDVKSGSDSNGTILQIYTSSKGLGQLWRYNMGRVESRLASFERCMRVTSSSNGASVVLYDNNYDRDTWSFIGVS